MVMSPALGWITVDILLSRDPVTSKKVVKEDGSARLSMRVPCVARGGGMSRARCRRARSAVAAAPPRSRRRASPTRGASHPDESSWSARGRGIADGVRSRLKRGDGVPLANPHALRMPLSVTCSQARVNAHSCIHALTHSRLERGSASAQASRRKIANSRYPFLIELRNVNGYAWRDSWWSNAERRTPPNPNPNPNPNPRRPHRYVCRRIEVRTENETKSNRVRRGDAKFRRWSQS